MQWLMLLLFLEFKDETIDTEGPNKYPRQLAAIENTGFLKR